MSEDFITSSLVFVLYTKAHGSPAQRGDFPNKK